MEEQTIITDFDYTMMQTFLTCRRKFYFRHVLGYVLVKESSAPLFGKAIHLALDSWYKDRDVDKAVEVFKASFKENLAEDDKRTHKMGEWILRNYDEKYKEQPLKLVHSEMVFDLPAKWGRKLIGRIDKIVSWEGALWIIDHKTSSQLGSTFPKMVEPNLQFDTYTWAAKQMGYKVVGVVVDALLVAKGLLESSRRSSLTPLLRVDAYRSDAQIEEFEEIAQNIQADIFKCQQSNVWIPNFGACTQYGECPYRRVCMEEKGLRSKILESSEYKIEKWDPRGDE